MPIRNDGEIDDSRPSPEFDGKGHKGEQVLPERERPYGASAEETPACLADSLVPALLRGEKRERASKWRIATNHEGKDTS